MNGIFKKIILFSLLFSGLGQAAGFGQASVYCENFKPHIRISYNIDPNDAGMTGLFWLGVLSPDQQMGAVLDLNHRWTNYQGGLYPPADRYDTGLPEIISYEIPFPTSGYTTSDYLGYTIYMGHGVLTDTDKQNVSMRRKYLDEVKPARVAAGTWNAAYDDDAQFEWALIQKDLTKNEKYSAVAQIPFLDCTPPYLLNH